MDYAHNPGGVVQLVRALRNIPVKGRRIVVCGAAGDRSDDAIRDTVRPLAGQFDLFIPKNYPNLRGREPFEVPALIREALMEEGVPEDAVESVDDELEAVQCALKLGREGDFLVLLVGHANMRKAWRIVQSFAGQPGVAGA
jgi:UDP-N-acetylmuramyl tripeptide synthase